jgi:REP-associated tyrosine transposase
MPRPPRLQVAGGLFHITTRSSAWRAILPDDNARATCLQLVRRACARFNWDCHAYCVMTTHYHLLMTTREENLSRGMQWLNSLYAAIFNETRPSHGHVFGARFTSVHVTSDAHLLHLISYIAMNPVGAGACARPEDWKFSSYTALIGQRPAGFLEQKSILRLFAFDPNEARRRIEEFVCPEDMTM